MDTIIQNVKGIAAAKDDVQKNMEIVGYVTLGLFLFFCVFLPCYAWTRNRAGDCSILVRDMRNCCACLCCCWLCDDGEQEDGENLL
jgi:hypothetical protein